MEHLLCAKHSTEPWRESSGEKAHRLCAHRVCITVSLQSRELTVTLSGIHPTA